MPTEIKIPTLGESIASGLISQWNKKDGDSVKEGDVLLTLETDKVAQEIAAPADGILRIQAQEGDDVPVGAVVGVIEESSGAATAPAPAAEAPKPAAPAEEAPAKVEAAPAPAPAAESKPAEAASAPKAAEPQLRLVPKESAPAPSKAEPAGRTSRKKMTPLRKRIAEQLVNAQRTAAILTTFNEVDMTAVMELRKQLQDDFVKKHGVKLGFMSFFVKAVVDALQAVPQLNVRVDGDEIISNHFYDIGVAVGTEKGLIVPVLRDCEKKTFAEIEKDILAYAAKAKEGKIALDDLTGGVFTISNGGVYGSLLSTPILNPPQSGILGMHSIQQRPVALNGQVVIRPMMYLAVSYDHRVVDGKGAVTFLVRIKDCLENPSRLLVGA
ncbi:dihydrolipoyllysine-residue succinyltransferase [Phragmitibacter flavus]|uniref:Dihydrolipoyllysine-residue succinyltransferase n=1 Tax=Phragmitibacter flavus TaxID=2576071 RepID=A0A5R8KBB3_9BACT|nr:dihydrolipoyllysine-residue succinyltransferase [Phragmitibacter flavus]TLD68839.1 dihydrolipoyllysine-residue succinyltransferase [Phragmitibacter flavus]